MKNLFSLFQRKTNKDFTNIELKEENYALEPYYFGYKSSWIAIKNNQNKLIADYIKNLKNFDVLKSLFRATGWQVDISSPYNGWTFLICEINGDSKEGTEVLRSFLIDISRNFTEVQYFGTHRIVEYHCWAKAISGKIERFYSYVGESGENIWIEGEPTTIESKYKFVNTLDNIIQNEKYYEQNDITFPDESMVMEIANDWSVSPAKFTKQDFEQIWTNAITISRIK